MSRALNSSRAAMLVLGVVDSHPGVTLLSAQHAPGACCC